MKQTIFAYYPESRGVLNSAEDARNYILGGRGVVTLESPTKVHHTYGIYKPRCPEEFENDTRFVYVLGNDKSWNYVGMISGTVFKLTRASRFKADSPIVRGIQYLLKMVVNENLFESTPMNLYHVGVCSVCGRKLTSPKSIQSGMGPSCRRKQEVAGCTQPSLIGAF